jgi:hypothetical protein
MIFHILKNLLCQRAAIVLLYALNFIGVGNRNRVQATKTYSSLDLTKKIYSISRLSEVEKENVIVGINPSNFSEYDKRKST